MSGENHESLFLSELAEVLRSEDISQSEFARASGLHPSSITDLFKGRTAVTGHNLSTLLRGIPAAHRLRLLISHLIDSVPEEYRDNVKIEQVLGQLEESAAAVAEVWIWDAALTHVISQLPPQTREQLYHFTKALRRDQELRKVFHGIMRYVPRDQPPTGHSPQTP